MGITDGKKELNYDSGEINICKSCVAYSRYTVFMTYMCLSLFFIPTFKWSKKYYVKASCCGSVFEPNEEQRAKLQELLFQSEEGDKIVANAMSIVEAMRMITDIEGLDDITNEELIDTIQTPDRVLEEVNFEINKVFTEIITNHFEKLSVMNALPKPLLEAHLKSEIEKIEAEERQAEEKARIKAELEAQQAQLEAQRAELEAKMKSLD